MDVPTSDGYFIPLACRFVPNDQWLVTHLHTSWSIVDVKTWLLAKCLPASFTSISHIKTPHTRRRRPVSPITFASCDDLYEDDADFIYPGSDVRGRESDPDDEYSPHLARNRYTATPRRQSPTPAYQDIIPKATSTLSSSQFTLISFSTGQILEDYLKLSAYSLHPNELLELHANVFVVRLVRGVIGEYIQPYFEARVQTVQIDSKEEFHGGNAWGSAKYPEGADAEKERSAKKRAKLRWQERWVVIHGGLFKLLKNRRDKAPDRTALLSSLISLRGAEQMELIRGPSSSVSFSSPPSSYNSSQLKGSPVAAKSRIICAKFRYKPINQNESIAWWPRASRDATVEALERSKGTSEGQCAESDDGLSYEKIEHSFLIILDMPDEASYDSILRALHRLAPSASSSFIPASVRTHSPRRRSYSPISFASISPSTSDITSPEPQRSFSPPFSVRYPEWRVEIVRRALKSGLGGIGLAMDCAIFGGVTEHSEIEGTDGSTITAGSIDKKDAITLGFLDSDSDNGDVDDTESEREWEGWEGDIYGGRVRREEVEEPGIQQEDPWLWKKLSTGTVFSPSEGYSFPSGSRTTATWEPVNRLPPEIQPSRRTLNQHPSVDSLLNRSLGHPIQLESSLTLRSDLPVLPPPHDSPLERHDETHTEDVRTSASDNSYDEADTGSSLTRARLPLSMFMTSITSTVGVGEDLSRAGKGKKRERVFRKKSRKRSSTVTADSSPSSNIPGRSQTGDSINSSSYYDNK